MSEPAAVDRKLGRRLVLDELFDLSLYQCLRDIATGELRSILDQLIPIEARHFVFWQDFFDLPVERLDLARRLKLRLLILACRLFGAPAIHLVLEAIEVYGVRKYLRVCGASYFAGALVPVLPMLGGARTVLPSLVAGGSIIVVVSVILAFLSGMEVNRRVVTNLVIIAAAVGVTFAIGLVTKLLTA
jgi:hypothetical protein